jgi:hypothetical protein
MGSTTYSGFISYWPQMKRKMVGLQFAQSTGGEKRGTIQHFTARSISTNNHSEMNNMC